MGVGTVAGIGDDVGCMVDGSTTVGAVADATSATVPAIASVGSGIELVYRGTESGLTVACGGGEPVSDSLGVDGGTVEQLADGDVSMLSGSSNGCSAAGSVGSSGAIVLFTTPNVASVLSSSSRSYCTASSQRSSGSVRWHIF